jgi:RNA polymerase sigma-70 factor (ECF subfamily)
LGTFRSQSTFYTWLRRITIKTFLNHQRSTSSERLTSEIDDWPFASEETVYNKVLFETVMSALASVSPSQRLMFLLRHYEGMSYDEIASAMNCSAGTAKKAVWRAITKLRIKLEIRNDTSDETVAGLAAEY